MFCLSATQLILVELIRLSLADPKYVFYRSKLEFVQLIRANANLAKLTKTVIRTHLEPEKKEGD